MYSKKNYWHTLIAFIITVQASVCFSASKFKPGSGIFEYPYKVNGVAKKMRVFYHLPKKNSRSSTVLFVMHGVTRDAERYRDQWIPHSESTGVILVVPEFNDTDFPQGRSYQRGNLIDSEGKGTTSDKWTYYKIDQVFKYLRKKYRLRKKTYAIYGHSAGAQFVHRMVLFCPEAKFHLAVAANAGYYCMPDMNIPYIYGLKKTPVSKSGLRKSFGKRLIVMVGMEDTDTEHEHLNKDPRAMEQGEHRFARGVAFYETASKTAAEMKLKLKWKLYKIPNVAHSNSGMAKELVKILKRK